MNDLIMIVIRFLLYLDLMVIFGLPFFQIYGISGVRHETYNLTNFRSFITFAVVTGIILTGINMLLVSNAMSMHMMRKRSFREALWLRVVIPSFR